MENRYCEYCGFEIFEEDCECQDWKDDFMKQIEEYN